jgi:hypothetical protein
MSWPNVEIYDGWFNNGQFSSYISLFLDITVVGASGVQHYDTPIISVEAKTWIWKRCKMQIIAQKHELKETKIKSVIIKVAHKTAILSVNGLRNTIKSMRFKVRLIHRIAL